LTRLNKKKHCASFLRYDIRSGLSSAFGEKKKKKARADHMGFTGEEGIGHYMFSSLKTEYSERVHFKFLLTSPV